MQKSEWVKAATELLRPHIGPGSEAYADSLYGTYVEESDPDCAPADAVQEDMSYWDAE